MAKTGRKPTPESTKEDIERIFLSQMHTLGGNYPKAVDVFYAQLNLLGDAALAESTMRNRVARLKAKYPKGKNPFILEPWKPSWDESQEQSLAETTATSQVYEMLFRMCRLKLDAQLWPNSKAVPIGLHKHEAKWAVRTHRPLSSAHEMVKILLALWYAEREVVAHYKGESPEVADLDAVLMYKPWLGGKHFRDYEEAVSSEIEPAPQVHYGEIYNRNSKTVTFSLRGIDALLFAFWGVINHPGLIRGAVWSIPGVHGANSRAKQKLTVGETRPEGSWLEDTAELTSNLTTEAPEQVPPFLRVITNPVADVSYEKLKLADRDYLLTWLAKIHKLPIEGRA